MTKHISTPARRATPRTAAAHMDTSRPVEHAIGMMCVPIAIGHASAGELGAQELALARLSAQIATAACYALDLNIAEDEVMLDALTGAGKLVADLHLAIMLEAERRGSGGGAA